jgi:hypothetical protein
MSERQRISLDGIWQFWFESELPPGGAALPEESARQARVPPPWQAEFTEMS